jgi:hypothetical protein
MSQQTLRIVAGIVLIAVLALAAPPPSHAAGFQGPGQRLAFVDRIWDWLESLVLGTEAKSSPALHEREGSMIDPNGGKSLTPPPQVLNPGSTSDEGSMIDPNGLD